MIALIAGDTDRVGEEMKNILIKSGWTVYSASRELPPETESIDLLILNIDEKPLHDNRIITDGLDYEEIKRLYEENTLKTLKMVAKYIPLLERGMMKRIALINAVQSSNNTSTSIDGYAYSMSKAALNMMIRILMNRYRPEGYTFRVFCRDGSIENEGEYAIQYILTDRSLEAEDPLHSDENRLVMRNGLEREFPW